MPSRCLRDVDIQFVNIFTLLKHNNNFKYANIDRILSCTEDSDFYELTYNGVIVLCGDKLFGYLYDKEEFTEEEILSAINNIYERTDKNG